MCGLNVFQMAFISRVFIEYVYMLLEPRMSWFHFISQSRTIAARSLSFASTELKEVENSDSEPEYGEA